MLISQQEPEITRTTYPFSCSITKGACYKPEWPGVTGHFELQGCALTKIEGSLNLDNQRCPAFYLYEKGKIFCWEQKLGARGHWALLECSLVRLGLSSSTNILHIADVSLQAVFFLFLLCFLLLLRLVAAVVFTLEMSEVSAIFIFTTKLTQPRYHSALTCKNAAFLMSFPRSFFLIWSSVTGYGESCVCF